MEIYLIDVNSIRNIFRNNEGRLRFSKIFQLFYFKVDIFFFIVIFLIS